MLHLKRDAEVGARQYKAMGNETEKKGENAAICVRGDLIVWVAMKPQLFCIPNIKPGLLLIVYQNITFQPQRAWNDAECLALKSFYSRKDSRAGIESA